MKSMFLKTMSAGAAMAAFLIFPAISGAAIISGNLNGAGTLVLTNGNVAFTNTGVAGGGIFTIDPTSTGFFAGLIGTTAKVAPLNSATMPVSTPLNVPNFIQFTAAPTVTVTLTGVDPTVFGPAECGLPAATGQSCGIPGTPFSLSNALITPTIKKSSDFFSISGTIADSATPTLVSQFGGIFTAQFSDKSFQDVIAAVQAPGGAVPTSYSASFTATPSVPEPATMSFMGLGLLALAAGVRRRARQ